MAASRPIPPEATDWDSTNRADQIQMKSEIPASKTLVAPTLQNIGNFTIDFRTTVNQRGLRPPLAQAEA
jgi:hypothetical protein